MTATDIDQDAEQREALIDELWAALLAEIERIKSERSLLPAMRGTALVAGHKQHPNHVSVSVRVVLTARPDDGSEQNFLITARKNPRGVVDFKTEHWVSHHDEYWKRQISDRTGSVVVDGRHYRIRPDLPASQRDVAGHAGREFVITFNDGSVIKTRNLWSQGVVPGPFRGDLPDNAIFGEATVAARALEVQS